jgi:excinuclease ABC subunit A
MGFIEDIQVTCPDCEGKRFKDKVLQVKYNNYSISDILNMTIDEASVLFSDTKYIYSKLDILSEVGLGYLTLGQPTSTLSGGELQRVKISKELGKLKGEKILYLLDEPTTGLHPKDIEKLINILQRLVSKGHSVIVIEHNLDVIRKSDWVIDFGPEGGSLGGNIVASGTPEEIANNTKSITGKCII